MLDSIAIDFLPFSPDNLKKFVDDLLADKLEPYFKSEPLPENNDGPVKVRAIDLSAGGTQ